MSALDAPLLELEELNLQAIDAVPESVRLGPGRGAGRLKNDTSSSG